MDMYPPARHHYESQAAFWDWSAEIYKELDQQIESPPGEDRIISECLQAYRSEIEEDSAARDSLDALMAEVYEQYQKRKQEEMPPSMFWYLTRVATVMNVTRQSPQALAARAADPSLWRETVRSVLTGGPGPWHEVARTVSNFDLASNVTGRSKSPLGFMALARERFGPQTSIIDFGCSLNLVLKAMYYRFLPRSERVRIMYPKTLRQSPSDTANFNDRVLPNAPEIDWSLGVDKLNTAHDPEAISFAFRCSYPSELLDDVLSARRKAVWATQPPTERVGFFRGDMTDPESMAELAAATKQRKAQVATFLFSSYEVGRKLWPGVLEMAKEHVVPDGFVYIMGHLRANPDRPGEIVHASHWPNNGVHSVALDLADEARGFQDVFRSNGRFNRVWLGEGSVALEPGGQPVGIRSLMDRYVPERRNSLAIAE